MLEYIYNVYIDVDNNFLQIAQRNGVIDLLKKNLPWRKIPKELLLGRLKSKKRRESITKHVINRQLQIWWMNAIYYGYGLVFI